ncbi:uncharacterized protein LOC108220578 [Daucus carota subsp. sativus]|uniref:uncharacterized protein LOC108220578 n=1 Tax=Daucus carota subsp. sativus TaxID=79200 RepID=UPI0007EFDE64|nr:PREDICTED: uncharacterized protein LOC108220578 [Daucus carota subsp. sativus]
MDFTSRYLYQRNTMCSSTSQSSDYTFFTQLADQCDMEGYNGGRYDRFVMRRDDMMEREMEKERIRREILEEEAARRRELEAEVRRDLRIEREREEREFRRRGGDQWERIALPERCYVERRLFEKRVALPVRERMYNFSPFEGKEIRVYEEDSPCQPIRSRVKASLDDVKVEELPFQRASQPVRTFVDVVEVEELPFQRASQLVRNSVDVVEVEGLPFQRASQPVRTCVDVVEVEELPFKQALQPVKSGGKSYSDLVIAEELPFQRAQPNKTEVKTPLDVVKAEEKKQNMFLAKPDANHPGKKRKDMASPVEGHSEVTKKLTSEWSCALCQISATSEQGLHDHLKGKKHKKQVGQKAGMIGLCPNKIINPVNPSQVAKKNVETRVENKNIDIVKKKESGGAVRKISKRKAMNFKFYCHMCEVGAFSEEIMNSHKTGKKHMLRLHQLGAHI